MPATLLLNRTDVMALVEPAAVLAGLRAAFRAFAEERTIAPQRVRSPLPGPGTAMVLLPGLVPGIPAYTVKVHAKNPHQQPAIRGVMLLHSLETGDLLAVMESSYLTALRTGLAGALAADVLANPDARRVAVIGCGVQGEFLLRGLVALRPIERVVLFDSNEFQAHTFAVRMGATCGVPITIAPTVADACAESAIILTATWAREPFLSPQVVQLGTHITTLGADEPGKAEVDAALIQQALFVCDDRDLTMAMGAVGNVGLGRQAIAAELGEILVGAAAGRTHPGQITIYSGVGLAFQDLVVAWQAYNAALAQGRGQPFDVWGTSFSG